MPNISVLKKQDSYKCTQCQMSGLKYVSSLCSISEIPWQRWRVSWNRRSFGRVSSPKKHQDGVDSSAAENPRCAMADCDRGRHHGLLPALWAECCKCPSSGLGISWGAPFLYNRVWAIPFTSLYDFPFLVVLIGNDFVRAACGKIHRDLYGLGFFKQKKCEGSHVMLTLKEYMKK